MKYKILETEKELAIHLPAENLKTMIDRLKRYCQVQYNLEVDVEVMAFTVDNEDITPDRARQLAKKIAVELNENYEDEYLGDGIGRIRCGPLVGTSVCIFYETKETPATAAEE